MEAAGLPTAKGSSEPISSADVASELADEIGYPVIIKAAAGGGGWNGVPLLTNLRVLSNSVRRAKSAFGDDRFR